MVSQEVTRPTVETAENNLQSPIYRLSVNQYHAMIESGILTEDDNVELLEGWLAEKMAKKRPHTIANKKTLNMLRQIIPAGWYVDDQEPITTQTSEPEPDIIVVRGKLEDYPDSHPTPPNIALVIEVSDTTLQRDRTVKQRIYAAANIPFYWLLNLIDNQLELYSQPSGTGAEATYAQRQDYTPDAEVPLILDTTEIARIKISDLLP